MGLLDEFDTRLRALGTAAREAGYDPRIVDGYRGPGDQAKAINSVAQRVLGRPASFVDFARGIPGYAAPVGGSRHETGQAADWGTGPALDWVRQNAARYGVKFPQGLARTDPVHSELDRSAMGPFQDPRDRDNLQAAAFETNQPATRMALGGPQPTPLAPQPSNGAPPMAKQNQGGFGGLLSAFANGMQSPLFMSGAAMYNAGAEGKNVGGGFLAGGQAAGQAAQQQMLQAKLRREQDIEQRQQQMWEEMTTGKVPPWATGLPQGTLELARALGPVAGPKLVSDMVVKQASANSYGKQGTIVQGGDGKFYSIQFSENGQRKIEPLEIGGGVGAPGAAQGVPPPGVAGQPVPSVPGQQPQGPVSLSPSRGVDAVGTQLIDKATGRPIRDVGPALADKKTQEAVGEAAGTAQADLPRVVANAERALQTLNQMRSHEGRQYGLGLYGMLPGIPGTAQRAFVNLVDQAKGQTFLEAFNSLRGGGAITEAEGAKATQALARLDRAQRPEDFAAAEADLEAVIKRGLEVARSKAQGKAASGGTGEWGIRRIGQ